jgi:hypothetical protein
MEQSLKALQGGGVNAPAAGSHMNSDPNAKISWAQSSEDIELTFSFDNAVSPKDVKVP